MKRYLTLNRLMRLTLGVLLTITFLNCTSEKFKESTDETLNITDYIRQDKDYSMFLEILEITNYASFMNTYGTYTLFLPTNDAIKNYLSDLGVTSIKDVPLVDLQNLVKLHILDQKVNTTSFTDGKIAAPSQYGQFLVTGASNSNGVSSITVNRTSNIVVSNIEVGNGVIHVIDKVLRVANKTLAKTIEADKTLTIFTEALKATGWYDKLNQPVADTKNLNQYLTVLTQTDEVFKAAGINNIADLKLKYSHLNDPLNVKDSLNLFVSYRIIPKLLYLADLAVTPAVETKAPLEVISVKLSKDTLLLNQEVYNGILEKGVVVNREKSDGTASNGVLHFVNKNFFIKKRLPAPVYFDVADQPEFRKLTSIFRQHLGLTASLFQAEMSEVTWDGANRITYLDGKAGSSTGGGWHGDFLEILRFRTGYIQNVQFKTPVIIKGKYKVWVGYRPQTTKTPLVKVYFDGVELPKLINFLEYPTATANDQEERVLESQGYKHHVTPYDRNQNSRLCGVIDVPTTGRHVIKFESLTSNTGAQTWIDVVEFRPIDMDQLWPKLQSGGDGIIYQ
ncbi:fasciclin domain-containing protein [Flavobacterium cellulosilyticum]|uniref:Fasciclin domain-containing protein n=1 Tax=Flavobacterium cellulosilyticum TaxID=2541731 RepID=A0A4R5C7L6_9FLAO|nr:fasciclin domain-containing protein [Flavobacterium cellulosilyticum]TDD95738.1 fasciclin domain-containing protein [Flavobacterium cellulosilyticum]